MKRQRAARGQALVEFALIIPVFILLMVSIFDLGHVVWANNALSNSAREGARFAIVHGGSESTPCPVGPAPASLVLPPASESCPFPSPSKQAIKDTVADWLIGMSQSATVSVCYGDVTSCVGDVDEAGATNVRGTPVTVTVTATIGLAAPELLGLGPFSLSASSTMLVNH